MNFSNTYRCLITVLTLLCMALPAWAAEHAASVLFSHGKVTASNNQQQRLLHKDDKVYSGDKLSTAQNSRAQLRFTDGALVSLMPNSQFTVKDYLQPENDGGAISMELVKGGLRSITGSIGKQNQANYELKTPVATLGIRGTEYVAVLDGDSLRVKVDEGAIALYNDQGQLNVIAGQSAVVKPEQAPELSDTAPMFNSASRPPQPNIPTQDTALADGPRLAKDLPLEVIDPSLLQRDEMVEPEPDTPDPLYALARLEVDSHEDTPTEVNYHLISDAGKSIADLEDATFSFRETHDAKVHDSGITMLVPKGLDDLSVDPPNDFSNPDSLFVWGPEATELTNADLHFSLASASPVIEDSGGDGAWLNDALSLEKLNLHITGIGGKKADFAAEIQFADTYRDPMPSYKGEQSGQFNLDNGTFSFSEMDLDAYQGGDLSCEQCGQLDAAGFVSGKQGEHAGIVYKAEIEEDGFSPKYSGAAILSKTSEVTID